MMAEGPILALPVRPEPVDSADRARLREDLDATFFVEAGAGTGKTTALVTRIVAMVAKGRVELDRLAAITFTEAAAAELRSRIRRDLERAASSPDFDETERGRCRHAAGRVDLASIQTIHAFAGTLLRTFPIEAGLPPGFQVWDNVQTDLAFDERFRAWLWDDIPSDAPEARERREIVRRALLLGMTFGNLRDLAKAFEDQADLLCKETCWPSPPPPDPILVAHQLARDLLGVQELFGYAKLGAEDPTIAEYRRHESVVGRLTTARSEIDALSALLSVGKFKKPGKQQDWRKDPTGQNALKVIKAMLDEVNATLAATLESHRLAALGAVLGYVRDYTLEFASYRRSLGVATFHDLLAWARDLLRDNLEVRQRARQRFARIFVDEFQDTDPLQAQIVWFLASDDATSEADHWRKVALEPGKLFVVGDPKQSIYRFRRADIGLYSRIYAEAHASTKAQLRENFRSVPAVIDWVNYQYRLEMVEEAGVQAPYVDLNVPRTDDALGGVHVIGGFVDGGASLAREQEAGAIARLVQNAVIEGRSARDKRGIWQPIRYRDVCVLLRNRANVRDLEDAFERLGVPYRMESGSFVFDTQEVRDLLACLRAIDDPSDQVALVAALRSPAYACSDVDLLAWVEADGKLDYLQVNEGLVGPVGDAFTSLRTYHATRADRSVAATVEAFLRDRALSVGVFDGPSPREAWRRLRYVVNQARELTAAGRPTLRALVDWLENLQRARIRDVESPVPDSDEDAVRVMTIHGAKGLEFPTAILTGLGSNGGGHPASVVVLPNRETDALEVKVGKFQTVGFADAKAREDRLEAAEQVRLFYVAATRARDHLVLSLFHGKKGRHSAAARYLDALCGTNAPPWSSPSLDEIPSPVNLASVEPPLLVITPEEHRLEESAWQLRRAEAIDAAKKSPVLRASLLAQVAPANGVEARNGAFHGPPLVDARAIDFESDDDEREGFDLDPEAAPTEPNGGLAHLIGKAVHAALAEIGPAGATSIDGAVARAAIENRVEDRRDDVRRLVVAALESPPVISAKSLRTWREVPLGIEVEGVILAGQIDLLVENPDGTLRIVDFKTESVTVENAEDHAWAYRSQGGAYALAIEEITRKRVSVVTLVFAALGGREVHWEDVEGLVAAARDRLRRNQLGSRGVL